jgi:hypothetical protein
VLVFALNLQDVKEICRCSMDLDEVLVRGRLRVWQLSHLELMRPLQTSISSEYQVDMQVRLEIVPTLTYWATWMPLIVNLKDKLGEE